MFYMKVQCLFTYLIVYRLTNFEVYSLQIYNVDGQKGDFISILVKEMLGIKFQQFYEYQQTLENICR